MAEEAEEQAAQPPPRPARAAARERCSSAPGQRPTSAAACGSCGYRTDSRSRHAYIARELECGYTHTVHKTTIEFDPAKRDAVAAVLGTKGFKATVDAAFDAVLRQHAGRELVRLAQ